MEGLELNHAELQLQFVTILKFGHLEELFGICWIKMSLLIQHIFHIFSCALLYTKGHHPKQKTIIKCFGQI